MKKPQTRFWVVLGICAACTLVALLLYGLIGDFRYDQFQEADIRFDRAIGPLLDRFIVTENEQTKSINISSLVRSFVKGNLTELRTLERAPISLAIPTSERSLRS